MLVVNCLDVDARRAAEGSVNVSRLFNSVLVCVCVEAYVTMNEMSDAIAMSQQYRDTQSAKHWYSVQDSYTNIYPVLQSKKRLIMLIYCNLFHFHTKMTPKTMVLVSSLETHPPQIVQI